MCLSEGNAAPSASGPDPEFYGWFWGAAALTALILAYYYWKMRAEQFVSVRRVVRLVEEEVGDARVWEPGDVRGKGER